MPLDGTWYNELGSTMTIQTNGNQIRGTYQTAVGNAQGPFLLVGLFVAADASPALGFVVAWQNANGNAHSATAWSGQYQNWNGDEAILTTWLLTGETLPDANWASTLVGQDVFKRTPPSPEEVEAALARRPPSHPVSAGAPR